MKKLERRALTLMELIVVVIIVGVLASIALPKYQRAREKAIDKQAQAILSLIRAAERTYKMETGNYSAPGSVPPSTINSILNLDLVDDGNWQYSITNAQGFLASLERYAGGYNRRLWINATNTNTTCMALSPSTECP